ncbi:GM16635 [Drosophila sechellia]|uniref:GM16635 n=1 Tax=Drosophila sechellia TaxID=7238 RepID=B4ID38_DROSE|nr:GM16635 [Drosophila sechellia]
MNEKSRSVCCQFVRTLCIPHSEVCYDELFNAGSEFTQNDTKTKCVKAGEDWDIQMEGCRDLHKKFPKRKCNLIKNVLLLTESPAVPTPFGPAPSELKIQPEHRVLSTFCVCLRSNYLDTEL